MGGGTRKNKGVCQRRIAAIWCGDGRIPDVEEEVEVGEGRPGVVVADLKGLYADDSREGHIPQGRRIPLSEIPTFIGTPAEIESSLHRTADEELRFVYAEETFPEREDMEFVPFYGLHNRRYLIYFPQADR